MGNLFTKKENHNNGGDIDSMYGYSLTRSSMSSNNNSRRRKIITQKKEDMTAFWIIFTFLGWTGIHYFILPSRKCLYIAPLVRLFTFLTIFVLIMYIFYFEWLYVLIILMLSYILYSVFEFIYIKKKIINNNEDHEDNI